MTAGGERVVLAAGDEADAAALAGTLGGLASAAPVKEAIQAADVVLFAATTGPRFSMTRARTRHPGSPDSHPFGRAAAPAPLQRHRGWVAAFADDGTFGHELRDRPLAHGTLHQTWVDRVERDQLPGEVNDSVGEVCGQHLRTIGTLP